MRWPWHREHPPDPKAVAAAETAAELFALQEAQTAVVNRLTARLVERKEANRFAEMVDEALRLRREQA